MRILIAEDDGPLASFIAKAFKSEDHITEIAASGEEALERLAKGAYDLLILDLNLPVIAGSQVLAKIRSYDTQLPILILTATDEVAERVACLDAGADDYLTKPFSFSELSARIRALLRRKNQPGVASMKIEDLELDYLQRTVHRAGRLIELTPKEFGLLEYFMRNPGRRITRNMIIEHVWRATNLARAKALRRRKHPEGHVLPCPAILFRADLRKIFFGQWFAESKSACVG